MERVDYVIKSHNELPYLVIMLQSLKKNNPDYWDFFDIKVFANDCSDGTKEWCDANDIWCEEVNLPGLYSVWNYGASITNNNFIIFSASDFYIGPGFWKNVAKSGAFNLYDHITGTCLDNGVSYPHPDIPERRWYNRDCGDNWQEFDEQKFLKEIKDIPAETTVTPYETSYCPFITTRFHYNRLDGFNTKLGDYPTDIDHDFVRRGKEKDMECCIVNSAFFYHWGKKSLLRRDGLSYDWQKLGGLNDIKK